LSEKKVEHRGFEGVPRGLGKQKTMNIGCPKSSGPAPTEKEKREKKAATLQTNLRT